MSARLGSNSAQRHSFCFVYTIWRLTEMYVDISCESISFSQIPVPNYSYSSLKVGFSLESYHLGDMYN